MTTASVVVPIRDGGAHVVALLAALDAQTLSHNQFNVLIGDDGSRDGVLDCISSKDGRVRVSCGPRLGAAAASNRAAQAAAGAILAFTDVDCRPEPRWLEAGVAALQEADLAAGNVRSLVPTKPSVWALLYMERLDQEREVRSGWAGTANLFVRRELFDRLGGFDASLISGFDFDFVERCTAAGARLAYAPAAVVHHASRDHAREFLGKTWRNNRWHALRKTQSTPWPSLRQLLPFVPIVGPIRARRRFELSLRLDRRRLAEYGVEPRLRDDVAALVLLYLVLPPLQGAASLHGWLTGRQRARRSAKR